MTTSLSPVPGQDKAAATVESAYAENHANAIISGPVSVVKNFAVRPISNGEIIAHADSQPDASKKVG